jgi:hypothetical protein
MTHAAATHMAHAATTHMAHAAATHMAHAATTHMAHAATTEVATTAAAVADEHEGRIRCPSADSLNEAGRGRCLGGTLRQGHEQQGRPEKGENRDLRSHDNLS